MVPHYLADAFDRRLVLPDGATRILLYYGESLMRVFTANELDRLRFMQENAMQDTCIIKTYSSTPDAYGNPTATYTDGEAICCGFEHINPTEIQDTGEVPIINARLRLPLVSTYGYVTQVSEQDRITVTHRYGEELTTPQVFDVIGPVERGPSGLELSLRILDDD